MSAFLAKILTWWAFRSRICIQFERMDDYANVAYSSRGLAHISAHRRMVHYRVPCHGCLFETHIIDTSARYIQLLQRAHNIPSVLSRSDQSWALSVFLNFFKNKKCLAFFINKVNNLFLHQSYLKTHSQSNYLDKKWKNSFFIIEKII